MSPNIKLSCLIGGMMLIMLPVRLYSQDPDREHILTEDIKHLGERAVRDRIISEEEHREMISFIRDSLPEGTALKVRALEQIRNELDEQYAEMVMNSLKMFNEAAFIGESMLPEKLDEPEGYISLQDRRRANEMAAVMNATIDIEETMKHIKPLPMKPWLRVTMRLLFGGGVNQRPERWDYTVVPQMGRLYNIIMPGGRPDDSWRDAPKMFYDPHPDKHFRR